jgi:hypothetical protein
MKQLLAIIVSMCLIASAHSIDKKAVEAKYKGKFVTANREGLAVGLCNMETNPSTLSSDYVPPLVVRIDGLSAKYKAEDAGFGTFFSACKSVIAESVNPGELLQVDNVVARGKTLGLLVHVVDAHEVRRGIGAFEHVNKEHGSAALRFELSSGDADPIPEIERWLTVFDKQEEAAKFGGAAIVKEVKSGMSASEVEQILGPPVTKVSLESKTLYRYKDMTVEFKDGKVSDVR